MSYCNTALAADPSTLESFSFSHRFALLEAAQDFQFKAAELKLYLYFVRYSDDDRKLQKTIEQIAKDLKMKSLAAIRRTIDAFIQNGIIRRLIKDKSFVYELTESLDWVVHQGSDPKATDQVSCTNSSHDKATRFPRRNVPCQESNLNKELSSAGTGILAIDSEHTDPKHTDPKTSTTSSNTPPLLREGCVEEEVSKQKDNDPKATDPKSIDLPNPDKQDLLEIPSSFVCLETKLQAVRLIGCNVGCSEVSGVLQVIVDGAFLSVKQFMERSLDSFRESLSPYTGMNPCRAIIEKLIARKKDERLKRIGIFAGA